MTEQGIVFLSYAREDLTWAERLYADLRRQHVNAWLDARCLKPGADWKHEIRKTIRSARYFILLLSRHSVGKRGFVQREIKEAIGVLKEMPRGGVYLIPARLDATVPVDEELQNLNWVDLVPDYHDALARILSAIEAAEPAPLIVRGESTGAATPVRVISHGKETVVSMPLMIGARAAVRYAPFRTAKEFLQQFMDRLPTDTHLADTSLSYYIEFDTRHPRVLLSDDMRARYPEHIVVVLQLGFRNLEVREEGVSVQLKFDGVLQTVGIPYEAIRTIAVPEVGLAIHLSQPERLAAYEGDGS